MNLLEGPHEMMRHVPLYKAYREETKWKNHLIQDVHVAAAT